MGSHLGLLAVSAVNGSLAAGGSVHDMLLLWLCVMTTVRGEGSGPVFIPAVLRLRNCLAKMHPVQFL